MSQYEQRRRELLHWTGASTWLVRAIRDLDARDPVNALHDVQRLAVLQQLRADEALRLPPLPQLWQRVIEGQQEPPDVLPRSAGESESAAA